MSTIPAAALSGCATTATGAVATSSFFSPSVLKVVAKVVALWQKVQGFVFILLPMFIAHWMVGSVIDEINNNPQFNLHPDDEDAGQPTAIPFANRVDNALLNSAAHTREWRLMTPSLLPKDDNAVVVNPRNAVVNFVSDMEEFISSHLPSEAREQYNEAKECCMLNGYFHTLSLFYFLIRKLELDEHINGIRESTDCVEGDSEDTFNEKIPIYLNWINKSDLDSTLENLRKKEEPLPLLIKLMQITILDETRSPLLDDGKEFALSLSPYTTILFKEFRADIAKMESFISNNPEKTLETSFPSATKSSLSEDKLNIFRNYTRLALENKKPADEREQIGIIPFDEYREKHPQLKKTFDLIDQKTAGISENEAEPDQIINDVLCIKIKKTTPEASSSPHAEKSHETDLNPAIKDLFAERRNRFRHQEASDNAPPEQTAQPDLASSDDPANLEDQAKETREIIAKVKAKNEREFIAGTVPLSRYQEFLQLLELDPTHEHLNREDLIRKANTLICDFSTLNLEVNANEALKSEAQQLISNLQFSDKRYNHLLQAVSEGDNFRFSMNFYNT